MTLLPRLLLTMALLGAVAGLLLRRSRLSPAGAALLALLPLLAHAAHALWRLAPRAGADAAAGYALGVAAVMALGGWLAWRWRRSARLGLAPLLLALAALAPLWLLGRQLTAAGESLDPVPVAVFVGASVAVAAALAVFGLRRPLRRGPRAGRDAPTAGGELLRWARRLLRRRDR